MAGKPKITPCLWFDGNAEAAINHYLSIFKDGRMIEATHRSESSPGAKGSLLVARFELAGQQFIALNGGPHYKFSPAISMSVDCQSQGEVDELWDKLSAGGKTSRCGWLDDKFGLSWQIVPSRLPQLLQHKDPKVAARVMQAMLQMTKIDLATLEAAADGP